MHLPVFLDTRYRPRLPTGHRFPMGKYLAVAEALRAHSAAPGMRFLRPKPLSEAQLARAHDYWPLVRDLVLPPAMEKRLGLPMQADVRDRALAAAAGSYAAALTALDTGLACNLAGGSHHADQASPAGFCTLNDVGIAARALLDQGQAQRILVLDLDVHQGDGTARMFAADPRVVTASLHCADNYPFDKAASDVDVALAKGSLGTAYRAALEGLLERLQGQSFDLVFYNAGVDPHQDDALGHLALSGEDLADRDDRVLDWAASRGLPLVTLMGGGYQRDLRPLAALHAQTVLLAAARLRKRS